MHVELPLSRYHFEYHVESSVFFPQQSGSLWHSVLGKSLKDLVCIAKYQECTQCSIAHQCDYTGVFTGIRPENSEIMRKYSTIPAPHVFQTTLAAKTDYKPNETLGIDLVLCGHANDKLPSLVRALYVAGLQGVGKSRGRLQLKQVTQFTGNELPKALLAKQQLLEAITSLPVEIPVVPSSVKLTFVTPYKPSGKADNGHGIDFGRFLMAIIRRVDLIQYFSTGVKLQADFKALKALTESLEILNVDLDFRRSSRYSAAAGREKDTSGFMGSVAFNLNGYEALWPFIYIGQWLNVGKNASMGFGRYVVGEEYAGKDNSSF